MEDVACYVGGVLAGEEEDGLGYVLGCAGAFLHDGAAMGRMTRFEGACDRAYHRGLRELLALRTLQAVEEEEKGKIKEK